MDHQLIWFLVFCFFIKQSKHAHMELHYVCSYERASNGRILEKTYMYCTSGTAMGNVSIYIHLLTYSANLCLCRVHWWMMRVWLLSLATPSAQLKRSLRNYRLLPRPRSRSMLPERSTDLVGHDNWLSDRIHIFLGTIDSGWLLCACQVQVQSHKTDSLSVHNPAQVITKWTLSKRKYAHHTFVKTDLVHNTRSVDLWYIKLTGTSFLSLFTKLSRPIFLWKCVIERFVKRESP